MTQKSRIQFKGEEIVDSYNRVIEAKTDTNKIHLVYNNPYIQGVIFMKKNIFLSFGLSASILVSSCFSVPFVSAETTNNEQIEKLLESFIEQNYKGDARVYEENDFVHVEFRKTSANEPYFDTTAISEDFDQFFKENNIDSSLVVIGFLEGIAGASPVDKDTEQLKKLLESFIEQNYKGDARVYEENDFVHVEFRKTSANEPYFDTTAISEDFDQFFKENNIDSSLVVIEFLEGTSIISNAEKLGDINLNGTIDVTDLTELSLVLIGDKELSVEGQKAADVDGDGAVTLADLARLQQYISKKIDSLR